MWLQSDLKEIKKIIDATREFDQSKASKAEK